MSNKAITLSPTRWHQAAERLVRATEPLSTVIRSVNRDGMGDSDAQDMERDLSLAAAAMHYVAEYAADKCQLTALTGGRP